MDDRKSYINSNLFCKDFKDVCIFHDLSALTVEETTSFLFDVCNKWVGVAQSRRLNPISLMVQRLI